MDVCYCSCLPTVCSSKTLSIYAYNVHVSLKTHNKRLSEPAQTLLSVTIVEPLPPQRTHTAAATPIFFALRGRLKLHRVLWVR